MRSVRTFISTIIEDNKLEIETNQLDLGEKKLQKVVCPEVWKEGSNTTRKLNENKLLTQRRPGGSVRTVGSTSAVRSDRREKKGSSDDFNPYARRCKICSGNISQQGAYYCQDCAYKKGKNSIKILVKQ